MEVSQRKCFLCGKFGHVSVQCPSRKDRAAKAMDNEEQAQTEGSSVTMCIYDECDGAHEVSTRTSRWTRAKPMDVLGPNISA